eukprot:513813_1
MATMFLLLYLLIVWIKSQRVTIFHTSFLSNDNRWSSHYSASEHAIGGWESSPLCPSGGSCQHFIYKDEFYTHIDTIGYTDIEISYDVRTEGLVSGDTFELWWSLGNAPINDDTFWTKWILTDNTCNSAVCNEGPFSTSNAWDDTTGVGIDFYGNFVLGKHAYLNNVLVTGISISTSVSSSPTPAPTPAPTPSPTPSPTPNPTPRPSQRPSHEPSQGPSQEPSQEPSQRPSQGPSHGPSHGPSQDPLHDPSHGPSHGPSQGPSQDPSHSPTLNSVGTVDPSHHPSRIPTARPTNNPFEIQPFTSDSEEYTRNTNKNENVNVANVRSNDHGSTIATIVICSLLIVGLLIGLVLRKLRSQSKSREMEQKENIEHVARVMSISNQSSPGMGNAGETPEPGVQMTQFTQAEERTQYGVCTDCGLNKEGKIYEWTGLFYCVACWSMYDDVDATTGEGGEQDNTTNHGEGEGTDTGIGTSVRSDPVLVLLEDMPNEMPAFNEISESHSDSEELYGGGVDGDAMHTMRTIE